LRSGPVSALAGAAIPATEKIDPATEAPATVATVFNFVRFEATGAGRDCTVLPVIAVLSPIDPGRIPSAVR